MDVPTEVQVPMRVAELSVKLVTGSVTVDTSSLHFAVTAMGNKQNCITRRDKNTIAKTLFITLSWYYSSGLNIEYVSIKVSESVYDVKDMLMICMLIRSCPLTAGPNIMEFVEATTLLINNFNNVTLS